MTGSPDDRARCWAEFLEAAEAAVDHDYTLARELVARHPIVRDELRAFVRAIVAGRLVKTGKGYRMAKGRAKLDRQPARPVVEA